MKWEFELGPARRRWGDYGSVQWTTGFWMIWMKKTPPMIDLPIGTIGTNENPTGKSQSYLFRENIDFVMFKIQSLVENPWKSQIFFRKSSFPLKKIITGWWSTYPSEKWWSSSVGIMKISQLVLESHSKFHMVPVTTNQIIIIIIIIFPLLLVYSLWKPLLTHY